jgi:hypothetical protein
VKPPLVEFLRLSTLPERKVSSDILATVRRVMGLLTRASYAPQEVASSSEYTAPYLQVR